jgi:hypothetical protein
MKQRLMLGTALFLLVALAGAAAAKKKKADRPASAPYVHVVIFRLKKDAPSDAVEKVIAGCHRLLAKIPSVRGVKAGRPAKQGTPELARKDYDLALLVLVEDYAGLKAYLEDPLHLKFVDTYGKWFDMEKLQVFDFEDQKK